MLALFVSKHAGSIATNDLPIEKTAVRQKGLPHRAALLAGRGQNKVPCVRIEQKARLNALYEYVRDQSVILKTHFA